MQELSNKASGLDGNFATPAAVANMAGTPVGDQLRLQAQLLDSVRESVIATDLDGNVIFWSKGAQELYGHTADEVMGRSITLIVQPQDKDEEKSRMRHVFEHGKWSGQYVQVRKDGTQFWADTCISLVTGADGQPCGFIGIDRDISELKRRDNELKTLSDAVAQSTDGINLTDLQGKIVFCNEASARLYGYGKDELLGRHVDLLNVDSDLSTRVIIPAIQQFGRWHGEIVQRRQDGSSFLASITASLIKDQRDNPIGMVGLVRDVTDDRKAQEALEVSEAQLRSVLNTATDFIMSLDLDGNIIYINRVVEGLSRDDVIGRSGFEFIPPTSHELFRTAMQRVRETSEPYSYETQAVGPNGDLAWYVSHLGPVFEGEHITGFTLCASDITERKRAEEVLQRSHDELESRIQVRTATLNSMVEQLEQEIVHRTHVEQQLRESEHRFRIMADTAPVMIWTTGRDKRCIFVNKNFLSFTDRTMDAELGYGWADRVHGEDVQRLIETYHGAFDARRDFKTEFRLRRHDGVYRWIIAHGTPRISPDGEFEGYIGSAIDITERIHAEVALQKSEQQLRLVTDNLPIYIAYIDRGKCYRFVNRAYEKLLGQKPEQLIGRQVRDLLGETVFLRLEPALDQALAGTQTEFQCAMDLAPNRKVFFEGVFVPDASSYDEAAGVYTFVQDVTQRKRLEDQLQQEASKVAQVGRLATIGELATGLAHEVNQPLASVSLHAELLESHATAAGELISEECRVLVKQIIDDSHRASEIIGRLRELIKKSEPRRTTCQINDLIGETTLLMANEFRRGHVNLLSELDPRVPTVLADRTQLQQVLVNLLQNAIEAMQTMPADQRQLTVRTTLDSTGVVQVAVQDSGPGIAPAVMEKIFASFYTTKSEGLGMGLAISQKIIEAHGGKIWAASAPHQPTTLLFTIPAGE